MAKMKWGKNGRGMVCRCGNGFCYHYGKSSGTNRTFLTVRIVRITKARFKDGYRFIILHVKKNNMIYNLVTDDTTIIRQLYIGAKIDCVGEPIGGRILILKEITFI